MGKHEEGTGAVGHYQVEMVGKVNISFFNGVHLTFGVQ